MEAACDNVSAAFPLLIVCGLSGAGKSTALNVFEDMRFFTVDGLLPSLAPKMVSLFTGEKQRVFRGLALGVDVRQFDLKEDIAAAWTHVLEELRSLGACPQVLFVEARSSVLLRRYAATRRPHPMAQLLAAQGGRDAAHAPGGEGDSCAGVGLEAAIEREREALLPLRQAADLVIDTSTYSIHDLRRMVREKWAAVELAGERLTIHCITFGFKYGPPTEADLVFDLRFLPNPYFVEELRPLSGRDQPIVDFVLAEEPGRTFLAKLREFLLYLVPLYEAEGRYRLTIAIGCTGGRHRSVAVAEAIHKTLRDAGHAVSLEHRHMALG